MMIHAALSLSLRYKDKWSTAALVLLPTMTALNVVVVIITAPRMKFKLLVNAGAYCS